VAWAEIVDARRKAGHDEVGRVTAESQTLVILRNKRDEIQNAIVSYEKKLAAVRRDLAHVNACIRMFELPEARTEFPVYVDTLRLFRRGEIVSLCKKALTEEGPLTTRELANRVIREKGFDEGNNVLRTSITYRIVQAMRLQRKRGKVDSPGKNDGARLWQLSCPRSSD
jgi:hypothetical protein